MIRTRCAIVLIFLALLSFSACHFSNLEYMDEAEYIFSQVHEDLEILRLGECGAQNMRISSSEDVDYYNLPDEERQAVLRIFAALDDSPFNKMLLYYEATDTQYLGIYSNGLVMYWEGHDNLRVGVYHFDEGESPTKSVGKKELDNGYWVVKTESRT